MTRKYGTMILFCAMAAGLLLAGCAKVPGKLLSPTLRIEPVPGNNTPMYKLMLSTGMQNENDDVVFLNMKGNVFFKDTGKTGARVLTVPFELPVLLPFDTGIIEIEKIYPEAEIMPLVRFLGSDRDKLASEKAMERSFADDDAIGFELTGYEKKNILDVLKDKVNEKN